MAALDPAELIADARTYAQNVLADGQSAMGAAMSALGGLTAPQFLEGFNLNISPPTVEDIGAPPAYTGQLYVEPLLDAQAPVITAIAALNENGAPGNAPSVADFNMPREPSGGDPNEALLTGVPTTDVDYEAPAAPDLLGELRAIEKPTLLELDFPDAPTYVAPVFEGVRPTTGDAPPTDLDTTMREQYEIAAPMMRGAVGDEFDRFMTARFPKFAQGLAAIEDRLETYLDGGSALTPAIENQIFNRATDKVSREGARAKEQAWGEAAKAGFTMPSVTLLGQVRAADQAMRDALSRAATDIAVKQAELEQQNLQFAVTQSTNLRQIAINAGLQYYGGLVQLNGQALDYARSVVDSIVKSYELAVRYHELRLRAYEADANVFRARVEAARGIIDVYTARINAEVAKTNANRAQVDVYRAHIDAVKAEGDVYRTQVDALVALAGLQRLKIDLYQARVQAYAAQVNAYSARWQAFEAQVRGEAAKVQASAEEVRAYQAQASAYAAVMQARATAFDAKMKENEGRVRLFQAQVDAYRAQISGQAESVRAQIESYDATIKAYVAKASAVGEKNRAEIAAYEAALRGTIASAEMFLRELTERNRIAIERAKGIAEVAVAAGTQYSRLAESTMSGMNSLAATVAEQQI